MQDDTKNGQPFDATIAPGPTTKPEAREWCDGLPLSATRPLRPEERAELEGERRTEQSGCWKWGCSLPMAAIFAWISVVMIVGWLFGPVPVNSGFNEAMTVVLMIAMLGGPAYFLLRVNDVQKINQAIKRDLQAGTVKIYRLEEGTEPDLNRPIHTLEVLAASRRIWSINGTRPPQRLTAPAVSIAEVPETARLAAIYSPAPVRVPEGGFDASLSNRRPLSLAETEELRRHARQWRRALWPAGLLGAFLVIPLLACLLTGTPITLEPSVYFMISSRTELLCTESEWGEVDVEQGSHGG